MGAAPTLTLHRTEHRVTMDQTIDLPLKVYLDEKFGAIEQQISAMNATTTSHQSKNEARFETLITRIAHNESEIKALRETRVTIPQLLVAVVAAITATAAIITTIMMIIAP